ncbi:MAG: phosphate acyltransferase, partial [Aquihabitans sp.]
MARSIYIASLEGHSGKSLVALGVMEALSSNVQTPGVFRPVTRSVDGDDHVLRLLLNQHGIDLPYEDCIGVTYEDVHADPEAALATIVERYRALERRCEAVVIVGSDYTDVAGPTELTFNARVAANLGAPVLVVVSSFGRTADEIYQVAEMAINEIAQGHAITMGVMANRCDPARLDEIRTRLEDLGLPAWSLPEVPLLSAPIVGDLMEALDGELLLGDTELLNREAEDMLVCGMSTEHVLERLDDGQLCITAGDRPEILVALATANSADGFPSLAGIVLNGGYPPSELVMELVEGLGSRLPILATDHSTYDTARIVASTRGFLGRGTQRKVDTALRVFDENLDPEVLLRHLEVPPSTVVTPLMFESNLLERARTDRRTIVLPEGKDERILRAASTILARQAADLIVLGVESELMSRAVELGLDLSGARFIDPATTDLNEPFAQEYTRLRAHRGMELDRGREIMRDVS